jgi:hypothetical protein
MSELAHSGTPHHARAAGISQVPDITPAQHEGHMEYDWRSYVLQGLEGVKGELSAVKEELAKATGENQAQHAQMGGRLDVVIARFERALEESNKKLEARNVIIRILVCVIIFLAGLMIEAKAHLVEFLKVLAG